MTSAVLSLADVSAGRGDAPVFNGVSLEELRTGRQEKPKR